MRVVIRSAPNLHDPAAIPALVARLSGAGVKEVLVQCKQDDSDEAIGGSAFYPSDLMPVAAGFEDGRLARFVDALVAADMRVFGWVPAMNDAAAAQAHPEWRAWVAAADGSRTPQHAWLCPRHPDVVEHESNVLREVVERFPSLSGVYTDFIRFDSDHACVCDRCLAHLAEVTGDTELSPQAIHDAGERRSPLWTTWIHERSKAICGAVDAMRDAIDERREGLWFGACVLPFSAQDYTFNTQSGQDFYEMARVGLDEIVVMGYWDDWWKSPEWLSDCLEAAESLVEGECTLSCLLDGDMSIRRTCRTLEAVSFMPPERIGYFHYGPWTDRELGRIRAASAAIDADAVPHPAYTAVAIRIDTEPDYTGSYDAVDPTMIDRLVDMFDAENVDATFVTCGKLAELQPDAIRRAERSGHEIACHAYDHEQLDSLSWEEQVGATDRGIDTLRGLGLRVDGFGAPRNSITEPLRDHLIDHGMAYDGSLAYDPLTSYLDAAIHLHPSDPSRSIVTIPFVIPNDWDALRLMNVSPEQMLELWIERLDHVTWLQEPVFVIDVHQWLAAGDAELATLRAFIREVKSRPDCRMVTLRDAAAHARDHVLAVERAAMGSLHGPLRAEASP